MKGLYVARLDLGSPHLAGVARKIKAQIDAFSASGATMRLLCMNKGAIELDGNVLIPASDNDWRRRINHHLRFHAAIGTAARQVDFAYIRFQGAPPDFVFALKNLRREAPKLLIVVEFPSWPFATERRSLRSQIAGIFQDLGLKRLKHNVDRIVTFSEAGEIFGVPTLCTDNGVDIASIPVSGPSPIADPVRLVGVANLSFWHGYDRVIAGLKDYRSKPDRREVVFDIIGSGIELHCLQEQVAKAELDDIVRFLGPLHNAELDEHLARCHVGVSSVGMHRLDVDTSNIKSREFCARGLPFIIGYPDRDFPDSVPFVYHVSADDTPLDIGALICWHEKLYQSVSDLPDVMRNFAAENLTWNTKLSPVFNWLRTRLD